MSTQLEGVIQLAPTGDTLVDCSAEIYSCRLVEERSTNTRRPTFANASEGARAGAPRYMLEIEFEETLDPSTSLAHAAITAAIRTDSGELDWSAGLKTGAAAADNPTYSGTVVVTSVSTGGEVGGELDQSQTFPGNADGFTIDTGS